MLPLASRLPSHVSSILMYRYPASFMPEETMASAAARTSLSVTLPAKRFQLFQPMGGVAANVLVCASSAEGMRRAASSRARNALGIVSPVRRSTIGHYPCPEPVASESGPADPESLRSAP